MSPFYGSLTQLWSVCYLKVACMVFERFYNCMFKVLHNQLNKACNFWMPIDFAYL